MGDGNSLFAVFDGHGGTTSIIWGHEVSKYVAEKFINQLVKLPNYKNKEYLAALDEAFRLMDDLIASS